MKFFRSKFALILSFLFLCYVMYKLLIDWTIFDAPNILRKGIIAFGYLMYIASFEERRKQKDASSILIGYNSVLWIGLMIHFILDGKNSFNHILLFTTIVVLSFVIAYAQYHHEKEKDIEMTLTEYAFSMINIITVITLIWFL